jgi:hypothetical protein
MVKFIHPITGKTRPESLFQNEFVQIRQNGSEGRKELLLSKHGINPKRKKKMMS